MSESPRTLLGIEKAKQDFDNLKNSYLIPDHEKMIKKFERFRESIKYRIKSILNVDNVDDQAIYTIANINLALYSSPDKFEKRISSIENLFGITQPNESTKTLLPQNYSQMLMNENTRNLVKMFYLDLTNTLLKKIRQKIYVDNSNGKKNIKCKTLKKSEQNWMLNAINLLQSKEFEKLKNHSDPDIKSIYDDTQNKIKDIENSVSDKIRSITHTKDPATGDPKDPKININANINLNTIKNAISNAKTKGKWAGHELMLQMMEFPLDMIDAGKLGLKYGNKIEEFLSKLVDGILKGDLKIKDLAKSEFLELLSKTRSEDLNKMEEKQKIAFYKRLANMAKSGDEKDENTKKEIDKFINNNKEKLKKDIDDLTAKNSINPKDVEEIKKLLSK